MTRRDLIKLITVTGFFPSAAFAIIPAGPAILPLVEIDSSNRVARKIVSELIELYTSFMEQNLGELNDSSLHRVLKAQCEDHMLPYLRKRLIVDFKVVCDDSNNPPSVIEKGLIGLDVAWKSHVGVNSFTFSVRPKS